MMSSKGSSGAKAAAAGKPSDEAPSEPKPLAVTLLQELQNLKDKFKNEDDDQEKGFEFYAHSISL